MISLTEGETRDVLALVPIDPDTSDSARRARVEELLSAYPGISDSELEEIVSFLHSGKQFDVGMVCGDRRYEEKVEVIRKAHPESFGSILTHALWFLLLLVVPLALVCSLPLLMGRS